MMAEDSSSTIVTPDLRNQPLTEADAAARLGLKVATLRAWRHQGRGPAYVRLGRAIRYLDTDIEQFLGANRHTAQSDAAR
jgi:predicted site-specific integrase-resolvase